MRLEDDDVRWLLELLEEEDLEEIEVEQGEMRIRVRAASALGPQPAPAAVVPGPEEAPQPEAHAGVPVLAPMAGIFYRRPSPDAEPFVEQGDRVEAGDVVALIEVMKLFNEITAPVSGIISKVAVDNEERVEADQPLMYIQPASRREE